MSSPTPVSRRTLLTILGGSIATPLLAPDFAFAQEAWPTRPVRYVNGFPAGGATDTLSRILCQKMSELAGQSFVVENRGGAGGVLGADAVAKAPPDGYTVGLGGIAQNVLAIGSYAKLPFDPRGDFTFIGGMWQLPNILSARRDLFSSDLRELLAAFKQAPRKYTYASAGFGTTLHLSGEMMNSMAGVEVTHIPYKGAGPALTDLLGGRVDGRLVGDIDDHRLDRGGLLLQRLAVGALSHAGEHVEAATVQVERAGPADAGRRAGDEHRSLHVRSPLKAR